MLVLARKLGESLVINESIRVAIIQISGSQVKIGIEAAPEVNVMRAELGNSSHSRQQPVVKAREGVRTGDPPIGRGQAWATCHSQ